MKIRILAFALLFCAVSHTGFAQTQDAPPAMVPNSFANLAENVQDAVVNISTTQKIRRNPRRQQVVPMPEFPPGSPFQDFFEEFFNNPNGPMGQMGPGGPGMDGVMPNVQSLGSGFVLDGEKGLVVTNNHVIHQADEIQVILHDDTKLDAKVIGRDADTDLALLKVETTKKLVSVTWGDSDVMRVGDWVLAVGNPFGLGGTVTSGIISARQRNINAGRYDDFIQTDASINRGNSGGPMFNMHGQVIGINTAIFSPTGGSVGIGFAIPSNLARPVVEQLAKFGEAKRAWIGVRIQELTPEIAESIGLKSVRGALIASTNTDGPAAKAGIKQGDVVTKFGDKEITAMRFLPRVVADSPINKSVPVTVFRPSKNGGREVVLSITPTEMEKARDSGLLDEETPEDKADAPPVEDKKIAGLNMHVALLNNALRQQYQLDSGITGVVVTKIPTNSDAAEKGIRPGDVILEVNQQAVTKPANVDAAVKAAKSEEKSAVLLLINSRTNNNLRFVALKLVE